MRCLYCNKKLSLLKLAKGDSFCSPEHFDAHQLKLSNDAFQRLMSLPSDDTHKAPLVIKPKEEKQREAPQPNLASQEQDAALARLRQVPAETPQAKAPPAKAAPAKAPPYAPFAKSTLPPYPPNPPSPVVNGPEASEAVEADRQLAFPVHDVEATVCILNLYLRLSLAGTQPVHWTSERHLIVTPEYFNLAIVQPPLGLSTDFPRIESPEPIEQAPIEPERVEPVSVEPVLAVPVEAVPVEEESPVEAVPVEEELPVAETHRALPPVSNPRVPFLLAPSFQERTGTPIVVHSAANAVPRSSILAPALDRGELPSLDSRGTIPQFTRFSGNTRLRAKSSAVPGTKGDSAFPIQPPTVLPRVKGEICHAGWLRSNRHIGIGQPALESAWTFERTPESDLSSPDSLLVRPDALRLLKVDPAQLLAGSFPMDTVSLLPGVLEMSLLGQEALFVDPPACAMEFGWRAALGPFPAERPLPSAWQDQTSYLSQPDRVADGSETSIPGLDPLLYAPSCLKVTHIEGVVLPPLYGAKDWYKPAAWLQSDSPWVPFSAEYGVICGGSTMLPLSANLPEVGFKTGSGAPVLAWKPCFPASEAPLDVKFLPARHGAVLPPAKNWPRLESLPR